MKDPRFISLSVIATIFLVGCSIMKTEEKARKQYTVKQFMDIVQISGGAFSPDESKILVNSKETGIYNAFEIDIKTAAKKQLTHSSNNAFLGQSYFPGDDRILFARYEAGKEVAHLFVQNANSSTVDLMQDSTASAVFVGWSHDKKNFYHLSNSRDKRFFDLFKVQVENSPKEENLYPSEIIYQNTEGLNVAAISGDARYIALRKFITTNNSDMYLFDTETKKVKHLSLHQGDTQFSPQYFSSDGKKLYFLTDDGSEFMYLASYDIVSGEKKKVEDANWDLMYAYLSQNGKYRVVALNNDGRTEIKIYDESNGGKIVNVEGLPEGEITGVKISDSEKLMSFYVTSSNSPANLFVYNFDSKEVKQITNTMTSEINPADLVAGEVIRYKSFDGMEIPAVLYKPNGLQNGEKVPAILLIHNGLGGQTRLSYSPIIQHLVNHNYVILAVNNRGSAGYGKTFFAADDRRHGDVDLKDCIESKKFLATLPYVDTEKIGIMGGSYGGYMVMAALTFAPEEFEVGVNMYGITNWIRALKSIPPWWTSIRDALYMEVGDPVKDSLALHNMSPLFHARNIKKPFIVLQGKEDPRVLQVESDDIVAAAKANGVPVEYIIFPGEGHGFLKDETNIKSSEAILKFLDIHLKGLPENQAGEKHVSALNE